MPNLIGKILLDQYRVDDFIGVGGMSEVYRVYDLKRNTSLAMKLLRDELQENPKALVLFKREADELRKLKHPNIVTLYGLYEAGSFSFLLEEFIDGPTLSRHLKACPGKRLGEAEALVFLKALCAALGYAHMNGIVHCDVKPENVMVDQGGRIYVTDFGIARHAGSTSTTIGVTGTPKYMAPEQFRSEMVSPRTDIYALGVMLFEMLTGQRPFQSSEAGGEAGDPFLSVRKAHLEQQPPDPRSLNAALSTGLCRVILMALEKEPAKRFASTDDLFHAACAAAGVTPESVPDWIAQPAQTVIERAPLPPMSNRESAAVPWYRRRESYKGVGWVLAGGLLLFVSVILVMTSLNSRRHAAEGVLSEDELRLTLAADYTSASTADFATPTEPATPPLDLEKQVAQTVQAQYAVATLTAEASQLVDIETPTSLAVESWQQGRLVYLIRVGNSGQDRDLYILDLALGTEPEKLFAPGKRLMGPVWSPEGDRIAFYEEFTSQFLVLAATTGSSPTVVKGCNQPAWSPDAARFVCHERQGDSFFIFDAQTGKQEQTLQVGENANLPAWSPLGERIAYAINAVDGSTSIWTISLLDQAPTLLAGDSYENYAPAWSHDGKQIAYQSASSSGKSELWVMDQNGGNAHRITHSGAGHWSRAPAWSPDDRWLVYISDTAGSVGADYGEVFIIPAEGGEPIQVTNAGGRVYDWRVDWGR